MLLFWSSQSQAQQYFEEQFPKVWERTAAYTLEVARGMPENQYAYKPAAGSMAFGEQLLHIAGNISFLTEKITGKPKLFYDRGTVGNLDKAQIIGILEEANLYVSQLIDEISRNKLDENIEFGGVEMTKENMFYLLRDHQVHHRGQCVVYLRMVDVKAPPYVGW